MMLVGTWQMPEELLAAIGAAGAATPNARRLSARNPVHTSVSPSGCKGGGHRQTSQSWIGQHGLAICLSGQRGGWQAWLCLVAEGVRGRRCQAWACSTCASPVHTRSPEIYCRRRVRPLTIVAHPSLMHRSSYADIQPSVSLLVARLQSQLQSQGGGAFTVVLGALLAAA